ncbi:MAG: tetratricopeptide repeat protein, partial [Syntrophaceae bacterium]|nr:tetratricopeptide repeat protein [Syntrophaceae bacterium]
LTGDSEDIDALYGLAVTQDRLGMNADAQRTFERALRLDPEDRDLLQAYGVFCFRLGRHSDAETALNRVLKGDANDPEALLTLGRSLEAQGRPAEALLQYQRLETAYPPNPELFYALAMAYGKTHQQGESHFYFGRHFKSRGRTDSALFHFRAAERFFDASSPRGREIAQEISELTREERGAAGPSPPPARSRNHIR